MARPVPERIHPNEARHREFQEKLSGAEDPTPNGAREIGIYAVFAQEEDSMHSSGGIVMVRSNAQEEAFDKLLYAFGDSSHGQR